MGVAHSKSSVTPLSFWLHLDTDQTFQIRYITFLNSQWFKNGQPSKLEEQKNYPFYYWNGQFFGLFNFDRWPFWNQLEFRDVMYLILQV